MNCESRSRSLVAAALLVSLLQLPAPGLAEEAGTWNILGIEIDDKVLFDADYVQQSIEDSKRAVVDNIGYRFVDGETHRIDVEQVRFSDIYISDNRFIGLPIVCGRYRVSRGELIYRYIYLGSTAFTFVEERSKDFASSWSRYCGRA